VTNYLASDLTSAEVAVSNALTSFDSNGWTLGSNPGMNFSSKTYVGWCWKAGGSAVSNTNGTITSTVSANVDAGFSIGIYNGNSSAGATIAHGLTAAPELLIVKSRNTIGGSSKAWTVYAAPLGNTKYFYLNANSQAQTYNFWNNTDPTTSVFSVSSDSNVNGTGGEYVFYAFHSVAGYQKIGTYVANTSGQDITGLGFNPRFVLIKNITGSAAWRIFDSVRGDYKALYANLTNTEDTSTGYVSFITDGFRLNGADSNYGGNTFLYWAIA